MVGICMVCSRGRAGYFTYSKLPGHTGGGGEPGEELEGGVN
jgi:hypothetical protein